MRNHLPRKSLEVGHTAKVEGDEWLALWSFEDWLKKWYLELLGVIEVSFWLFVWYLSARPCKYIGDKKKLTISGLFIYI